ncbi:helix-turn-helix domain-containing protein [Sedimentibacter sp.]|uniref:helix-turn-helix domain-containing protein n=1 Tax=Sedimentibacter sp. TaxID=1960295 RepID=UPI00289F54C8|nr:helix-turn-helix domain-containing protein [Sedimentibacter sp.]
MLNNENIYQILNNFYKATGIGILFFDTELNITSCLPSKNVVNNFIGLGLNRITSFLTKEFSSSEIKKDMFYTFFLESNLVCNVRFFYNGDRYAGAFVTQFVFINKLYSYEMEKLLDSMNLSTEKRKTMRALLLKVPVVSYDRIMPMGMVLNSLIANSFSDKMPRQVLKGNHDIDSEIEFSMIELKKEINVIKDSVTKHSTFSNYLTIKESIQRGDKEVLLNFLSGINAGSVPMDQLQDENYVRSLKNNLIKVCSMSCYAAIEANAPYYKTLDIADQIISQMERLDNINDIYELMKYAMVKFTETVASSRKISYTKPIRQVIEYIEAHYAEKITLDKLAKHTNLSTAYLSNMIKKETGLNLMDNINKIRVEQSKKLLLNTNLSILEVALRVGFSYQNHFAIIFKKFTGVVPSDFRNPACINTESKSDKNSADEFLPAVFETLNDKQSIFNEIYDIVRVVDPIKHVSWVVSNDNEIVCTGTCYDFWGRRESCKNCISTMAYVMNDTFMKIDHQNDNSFAVIATPKVVGKNIYVIELLKKVTYNVDVGMDTDNFRFKTPYIDSSTYFRDELTGLYCRRFIDEKLPVCMRRNRHDGKPFSIVLSIIYSYDVLSNQYNYNIDNTIMGDYAQMIISSLENHDDWTGRYMGNILITALNNSDFEKASYVAETIEHKFKSNSIKTDRNNVRILAKHSVASISDDTHDCESLINKAILNLHDKMKNAL